MMCFVDDTENELRFTAIGGAPNGFNTPKGNQCKEISFSSIEGKNAFFHLENALDREIVHAMTWLPIKMFTTSVMEAAVDCWCWAMTGRPELELLVKRISVSRMFLF